MGYSRFNPRRSFIQTSKEQLIPTTYYELSGLNQYTPDESTGENETPYAKNFRIMNPDDQNKRSAITKRLGHKKLSEVAGGDTLHTSITSTAGASTKSVTTTTWFAEKFTTASVGRVSKIELNMLNDASGTGPLIIELRSDSSGSPSSTVLATTSIKNPSFTAVAAYIEALMIEAPKLATSTDYWIVAYIQYNGTNNYKWTSTTNTTTAKTSTNSGSTWSAANVSLNFKIYYATEAPVLGVYRWYPKNQAYTQLYAANQNVYSLNETTGAVTSIKSGLSAGAKYTKFVGVNNKVYYTNREDRIQIWDGTTASALSTVAFATDLSVFANKLWVLEANTNRIVWSNLGSFETFATNDFVYIPAPYSSDEPTGLVPFQGNQIVFTRNTKYFLYGNDIASISLRETTAPRGCVGPMAYVVAENQLYYLSDDGVYRFNGGTDQLISKRVQPIIDSIANKETSQLIYDGRYLRLYYRSAGKGFANNCLIYDMVNRGWLHDEDIYISSACVWNGGSDTNQLICGSSLLGRLFLGENGGSDAGKPIAWEYRTKYRSNGQPSRKKQWKRLYTEFRTSDADAIVNIKVDTDYANSPILSDTIALDGNGDEWGGGETWGSATAIWGGDAVAFKRFTVPGQARRLQLRLSETGADTDVEFLGYTTYIKMRRAV